MQLIHSLISKTQKSTAQIRSRLRIDKYNKRIMISLRKLRAKFDLGAQLQDTIFAWHGIELNHWGAL